MAPQGCCSLQNWIWFLELTSGCAASWEVGVEDGVDFNTALKLKPKSISSLTAKAASARRTFCAHGLGMTMEAQ